MQRYFSRLFFKIFPFLKTKIEPVSIDEVEGLIKQKVADSEVFSLQKANDVYGNFHEDFDQDAYTVTIPELNVYTLKYGIVENGLEEIYTSKKQVISEYTTQETNPRIGEYFPINPVKKIRGSLAYFNLSGLENYYAHFWCEYIAQIYLLWKSGIKADYYIFTQEHFWQKEFISIICRVFNIPQNKIISLQKGIMLKPDTLIFTSLINSKEKVSINGRFVYDKVYAPSFLKDIYRLLAESIPANNEYGEKIYITREKAAVRKSNNEKEVQELVKKNGFYILDAEDFSISEKIAIFKNAKYLISTVGSNNSSFFITQRKNAEVLLLYPYFFPERHFKILSQILNIRYNFIRCNTSDDDIHSAAVREDNLTVDLEGIKIFLDKIASER